VFYNNAEQLEYKSLKEAIELIMDYEGQNQELKDLIDNLHLIQHPTGHFITYGITYTPKHGVKIEQKIRV